MNSKGTITSASRLADTIAAHLNLKLEDRQRLLEVENPGKRLEEVFSLMQAEIEVLEVERKIRSRVKKQMERSQKEYYLNEQMRAIQKELGERDEFKNEIQELEDTLKKKKMPKEALERTRKEIRKLKMMSPMSAEATVVRNYIDWILSLPWDANKEETRRQPSPIQWPMWVCTPGGGVHETGAAPPRGADDARDCPQFGQNWTSEAIEVPQW